MEETGLGGGVDPDLLVFGKYFPSNVRVLPHHFSRMNASDPLPPDKRQLIHPPPEKMPLTPAREEHTTPAQRTCQLTAVSSSSGEMSPYSGSDVTASPSSPESSTPSTVSTGVPAGHPNSQTPLDFSATAPFISSLHPTPAQHDTPSSTGPTWTRLSSAGSTEASLQRNQTAGGAEGELGAGWHVAAHSVLVLVSVCVTVLLSCCCSVLLVATWRGQRRRMGRYRTSWRGNKGSMRLIKYVLVRENC